MHALLLASILPASGSPVDVAADAHREWAAQAMAAESDGRFGDAYQACAKAIDVLPEGPRTPRCRSRLDHLDDRRDADGGFTGWAELEAVRREARHLDPETSRARVVALLGREGLSDTTHAEATYWLAQHHGDRGEHVRVIDLLGPLLPHLDGLDDSLRMRITLGQAKALAHLGRVEEARAVEEAIRVAAPSPRPTPVQAIAHDQRLEQARWVSWGVLGAYLLAAGAAVIRTPTPRPRPWGLLPLAVALGGAWAVAEAWEPGAGAAMPAMAVGMILIHGLTAWARRPDASTVWRALLSVGAAAATLAVAFLALQATHTLGWVGL